MVTIQVILFCIISMNMILLILWREESEIKASGPILSMLIIIGCYLHCVAPVLTVVSRMLVINNTVPMQCKRLVRIDWTGPDICNSSSPYVTSTSHL